MGYYGQASVYRGDYYRGDYYRGDPLLGALLGKVAGKLLPKAAKWVAGRFKGSAMGRAAQAGAALARRAGVSPGEVIRDTAIGTLGYKLGQQGGMGTHHPEMPAGYESEIGHMWDGHVIGRRRYRRMNPLNPKALNRALRRAQGFEKFARKTVNALYKTVDGRRVKTFKKRGK